MELSTALQVLATVFAIGGTCALTLYRLRNVERIARKAHKRIDELQGGRKWIDTGVIQRHDDG
jgi:hypothetical protein